MIMVKSLPLAGYKKSRFIIALHKAHLPLTTTIAEQCYGVEECDARDGEQNYDCWLKNNLWLLLN